MPPKPPPSFNSGRDIPGMDGQDVCAVAEAVSNHRNPHEFSFGVADERRDMVCNDYAGDHEEPMLVHFFKLGQYPQVIIPTRIRLQSFNECLCANGDSTETIPLQLSHESVRGVTDRKHVLRGRDLTVGQNKLPNQIVERAPQVMDTIANDGAWA